ncbi:MAG TPA: alkaline phosphatase family protein [Candidatus Binataceae bacterium]|nr:alkaline phosphatase family protein [Candidatus Binataceae bacterium]
MNTKSTRLRIVTFARQVAAGHNKAPMKNHDPVEHGPERRGGQGLDRNQYESGDRAILALLKNTRAADQTDLVATFRDGAYEVWSRRGMVRFKRYAHPGGTLRFTVIEQIGENPIANQDPFAIASIDQELQASARSGNGSSDPNRAFFEPDVLSHPYAYERIAQVFDSPRGPDLIVSPKAYAYGLQPGQHGALDVVQSRAPLVLAGRGVTGGQYELPARQVDIAPTIARIMHFPEFDGCGADGEPARVMLRRQDGVALMDLVDRSAPAPQLVYLILLDGLSHSELDWQLQHNRTAIPAIASLVERGAFLKYGSIANFPSITWPSHSTIMTGTWCGHHDIVNPTFHLREHRETVPIQGNIFEMEHHLNPEVETLYEAFKRALGSDAITASINEPQSRGADHAVFERRILGDKARLKALTQEMSAEVSPRWLADNLPGTHREEIVDVRGMAQVLNLFDHCGANHPVFVAHEFVLTDGAGHDYGPHHDALREAIYRTDRRIGRIFAMLRERGLFDSALFVLTSDHGMAAQRIELKANPAREPSEAGIKGVFAEPMIYLRDLAVVCERARDMRSLRVLVADNDRLPDGVRPPVGEARVTVVARDQRPIGEALTTRSGSAAFATPANLSDRELTVRIEHPNFNSRTVTGDGTPIRPDLKKLLYGKS